MSNLFPPIYTDSDQRKTQTPRAAITFCCLEKAEAGHSKVPITVASQPLIRRTLTARRRLLTNDGLCLLVSPQPQENRLAKLVVVRPLGKLDLGDQHGFNPVAAFHHRGRYPETPSAF